MEQFEEGAAPVPEDEEDFDCSLRHLRFLVRAFDGGLLEEEWSRRKKEVVAKAVKRDVVGEGEDETDATEAVKDLSQV